MVVAQAVTARILAMVKRILNTLKYIDTITIVNTPLTDRLILML